MFIAAIDPVEEARLLHLDRTIVSGRFLRESDGVRIEKQGHHAAGRYVPVIASRRTYLGEGVIATINRLRVPKKAAVPAILATPRAYDFVTRLPATQLATVRVAIRPLYERLLHTYCGGEPAQPAILCSFSYWSPSNVRYGRGRGGVLRPHEVRNPIAIWQSAWEQNGYWAEPDVAQTGRWSRPIPSRSPNDCGDPAFGIATPATADALR